MSGPLTIRNGVQLRTNYALSTGPAANVFLVIVPDVPDYNTCSDAANTVAEWELDGASPGTSYRLFRSSETRLLSVEARSLDSRSRAVAALSIPASAGIGAETVSDALASNVAGIMNWQCLDGQARRVGRTYMLGLCHNVLEGTSGNEISDVAAGPLVLCWNGLIELVALRLGGFLALYSRRRFFDELPEPPISQVQAAFLGNRRVATQRRRLHRSHRMFRSY